MKTIIILLLTLCLSGTVLAQSSSYSFGREPMTTFSNLKTAATVNDISPLLWKFMGMRAADRYNIECLRKQDSAEGFYLQPPVNNYANIVTVVGVHVSAVSNGKKQYAYSTNGFLTSEQKRILTTADMSTNIELVIRFRFKNFDDIKTGKINLTVVPEQQALYGTGDFNSLADYLSNYLKTHYPTPSPLDAMNGASILFTVKEDGTIDEISMLRETGNKEVDQFLIEALKQMPKWKPARNANGRPVNQKICFNYGGC